MIMKVVFLGVEIFLTYKFGSKHSQIESGFVHLPLLQWIGFFPSETEQLSIPVDQLLPLTESDKRKIDRIAERAFGLGEQYIFDELVILMRNNWKLEIEAISSLGNQFLSTVYLKYKLQQYQTAANNLEA
jgi:DNA topoisomerase VI subunit A